MYKHFLNTTSHRYLEICHDIKAKTIFTHMKFTDPNDTEWSEILLHKCSTITYQYCNMELQANTQNLETIFIFQHHIAEI